MVSESLVSYEGEEHPAVGPHACGGACHSATSAAWISWELRVLQATVQQRIDAEGKSETELDAVLDMCVSGDSLGGM